MQITETQSDPERLRLIDAVARDAATLLRIDLTVDSPQSITAKVNEVIVDLVFARPTPVSQDDDPQLLLGALWGTQVVREFNWYWADVVVDDRFKEVAVISPHQEMIIFPFSFTAACIEKRCVCTILLSFNMLLDKARIGDVARGSYENIMLGVRHIVPPYTLDP